MLLQVLAVPIKESWAQCLPTIVLISPIRSVHRLALEGHERRKGHLTLQWRLEWDVIGTRDGLLCSPCKVLGPGFGSGLEGQGQVVSAGQRLFHQWKVSYAATQGQRFQAVD